MRVSHYRYTTRLAIGLALGLFVLSGAACGRRGSLEPPGSGEAVARGPASPGAIPQGIGIGSGGNNPSDPDAVRDGDEVAASATVPSLESGPVQTTRGAKRRYKIPNEPFLLDPIL